MSPIIVPPGFAAPKDGLEDAPAPPADLTRDGAIASLNADEAHSLGVLPLSTERRAATRLVISRGVFGVLTASMPPTMHPNFELVTAWERDDAKSAWRFGSRWVREPGGAEVLARLDVYFNVLRGEA